MRKAGSEAGAADRAAPTAQQLKDELRRERYRKKYARALRGTLWTLVVVAAAAILCTTFFFSVLRIQGSSMEPLLRDGELVLVVKNHSFRRGDLIAFYYNNKILLKRAIGFAGDRVEIDGDGNVFVNGAGLEEPYVQDRCLGDGDVEFPFEVPDGRWFVLGDHRSTSTDSRYSVIGTVAQEQIVGKVAARFWPVSAFTVFD